MSKKFTNTDIITTGSVQASDVTGAAISTGGGAFLLSNTVTGGTLTDGTATLSGGLLTANEVRVANSNTIISGNGIYCVDSIRSDEFRPYSGKSITLTSGDFPDTDPFIVKIKRGSQASCALELSEENASTGAIAGIRLSYQGATDEDLDVDADGGNFSALQIINRQDTDSIFNAYDILRSNSTATNVELLSEDTLAISAGTITIGDTVTIGDNSLAISAGTTTIGDTVTIKDTGSLKIEPDSESTRLGVMDSSIAIGSVGKLGSDGLLVGGFPATTNGSQTSSYLHIGHAQDTVDIRSEEVYLFKDAGTSGKYSLANIVDETLGDGTVDYSNFTRDLVWLPPNTVGADPGEYGRVYVAAGTAFTGVHRHVADSVIPIGAAVDLIEGKLVVTSQNDSTTVVGIVAAVVPSLEGDKTSLGTSLDSGETVHIVASVGDSRHKGCQGFNVCNENGDIQPGDLLVTSSTPGYLMKQDDDIIRSKTVGKAMEAVTFDDNGQATGVYGFIYCG
jgi:hypothetical protein